MLRVFLINILLFLLPFAIYLAIMAVRKPGTKGNDLWRDAPLIWLFAAGTALVFIVLVSFVSFSGGVKDGTYRPAEIKDGKIVPGRIERE